MNCASCHVYVDEQWSPEVGTPPEEELDMLEGGLAEVLPTSRLSCQIELTEELDGFSVTVAPEN